MEQGEEDDLVAVFTDDPVLDSVVHGQNAGVEAIREKWRKSRKNRESYRLRRMFSNFRFKDEGHRVRVVAYFAEFITPLTPLPNNPYPTSELLYVGEFECTARKVDGKWHMERRAVRVDSRLADNSETSSPVPGSK
jgi:hypothetical protein